MKKHLVTILKILAYAIGLFSTKKVFEYPVISFEFWIFLMLHVFAFLIPCVAWFDDIFTKSIDRTNETLKR